MRKLVGVSSVLVAVALAGKAAADDSIMLQGFYWDCSQGWWSQLEKEAPGIARSGFSAVWLPPASKGGHGASSMGYDPYDFYDLGEFDQKGTIPTRFGTKKELISLVATLHKHGVKAIADLVLDHMADGDKEANPLAKKETRTHYDYKHAGAKATFDYRDFHPSHVHPDQKPPYHNPQFGNDLCQAEPHVATALEEWGDWLTRTVGFDGYRLDDVKGIDPGYVKEWLSSGAMNGKFCVSEYWDGNTGAVEQWVKDNDRKTSAFDFPLFYALKSLCNDDKGHFDMRSLATAGLMAREPMKAVTFVENHDTARSDPVKKDALMGYAFILTMEGEPCVFYQAYQAHRAEIDDLIAIRKRHCGGTTKVLHSEQEMYVAQRNGNAKCGGCVLVLCGANATKSAWVTVKKEWAGRQLVDLTGHSPAKHVAKDGRVELEAPARGYSVYAPG